MIRQTLLATAAALAAFTALPAAATQAVAEPAAGPVSLSGDVKVDRTVTENGQPRHVLVQPDKVVPGERLVFTTSYRNSGTRPIQNFVVTNPLPPAVALAETGSGDYLVSVDGGAHWGPLASLTVADGKGGSRPATGADVTHLRWTIPQIAPGASGTVEYHATVR